MAWLFVYSGNGHLLLVIGGRLYTIWGLCFCYRPASLPVFVVGFHLPLDLCLCGRLFLGGGGVSVCVGVRRVVLVWFGLVVTDPVPKRFANENFFKGCEVWWG